MKNLLDLLSLKLLRRIAIRYRLINSFALVSLLPLLIAGAIAYRESSQASEEKIRIFAGEVVRQVAQNMAQQMAIIESSSERLAVSDRLQQALTGHYSADAGQRAAANAQLTRLLLENYGTSDDINQKYLLDRQHRIIDSQVYPALGNVVSEFVRSVALTQARPYWHVYRSASGQSSMVMLRHILLESNNRLGATLFVGLKPSYFSGIFDAVHLGYDSRILVIDSQDGQVVIDTSQNDIALRPVPAEAALLAAVRAHLADHDEQDESHFVAYRDQQKNQQLASFSPIDHTSWLVVSITPEKSLNREVRSIRNKIILIGLLCFVGSFALSFIIARSISLPLKQLVEAMRQTRKGNYQIRVEHSGRDEISMLANGFNDMANKVYQHNEQLEELVKQRTHALELANQQLAALSSTDSLTGIANRRRFDEVLQTELRRASRSHQSMALLMMDIDYFKNYNDHYGHLSGDDCLRQIGQVLHTQTRRASDLAARYGGEEFAVILFDSNGDSAKKIAENIRKAIAALNIAHATSPFGHVTCSIGVTSLLADDSMSPLALLRMADAALYMAKSQGRNQVVSNEIRPAD
ncbi:diguanylate cyclase (GGDEF)-like protein [Herbaspirillum sp. Sphag1AN]|uniref:GGDEF domain-containing protein n=1 Tax=unclassified Herbaspirillum TaxID=2624150 RepID=UPI00160D3913|nr:MULTISPECIES: sensor domain-containing diguanylate cyclase [unclassified Herbaspirillum]MBB3213655.1 diguanylate cyclase (GGDEF)-like protein [Herbaspirillum sp. Sphag1AN]MBB3246853.1 diguanylate cyclase (GGDEF)-like protein [Herbaspirillum sp. Sphag64]